jgi:hypothetical protein
MPDLLPDEPALELKVEPDDAIFGPGSLKDPKRAATKDTSSFGRFFRALARVIVFALLCGSAWAAGAYYSGHLPFDLTGHASAQQASERDEMMSQLRQMSDDIKTLKASIDAKAVAPLQPAPTGNVGDLAARIDKLEAELTTKFAQVHDQIATLEQQMSTAHPAVAARVQPHVKHVEHLHDAFDPSQNPAAVGAPRPLGTH